MATRPIPPDLMRYTLEPEWKLDERERAARARALAEFRRRQSEALIGASKPQG
jgi:hypothetical protein